MTFADQIAALMADHKLKMARDFDHVEALDRVLLDADMQLERNLRRIMAAHGERRGNALELLSELRDAVIGQAPYVPPIEDRYYNFNFEQGRAKQLANSIMDQVEAFGGGMN